MNSSAIEERISSNRVLSTSVTDYLWQRIKRESLFIMLPISNRCNMRCRICGSQTEDGRFDFLEMTLQDVQYILERIGRNKKVCFTIGEPTLNEDLLEFIRLTNRFDNIPVLFTNGIRLANFDYTKKLIESGIKKIYLSIDSISPLISQYFTGRQEYLSYKLKALDNLKNLSFKSIYLSVRIAKNINTDIMEDILKYAVTNNDFIKGVTFFGAIPMGWFDMPISYAVSMHELMLFLERGTKGNISREYIFEFNELRRHLSLLFHKFGRIFPNKENSIYASINKRQLLTEFISIGELRKINKYLAEKRYYMLIKYLFKFRNLVFGIKSFLMPAALEFEFYRHKGIHIDLNAEENAKCLDFEHVQIFKHESNFKIWRSQTPY
ncbi:MAG: radical SAM protein [Actinobacteria bacterium]|nr:radical SAM protein [Actinomycetota bacterium]